MKNKFNRGKRLWDEIWPQTYNQIYNQTYWQIYNQTRGQITRPVKELINEK